MTNNTSNYFSHGSLLIPAYLSLPAIPTVVGEWASLLPLVCHLASSRCEYQIVGEMALRGRLYLSLFPQLGVLAGISRFLSGDSDFLSEASSKGGHGDTVYDVNWGSIFPCANGEASRFLVRFAAKQAGPLIHVPEFVKLDSRRQSEKKLSAQQEESNRSPSLQSSGTKSSTPRSESNNTVPKFRRYQILRVIRISHSPPRRVNPSWNRTLICFCHSFIDWICIPVITVGLVLVGAYGTAIILLLSLLTRAICRFSQLRVCRPPGYLSSNESGDACMLMSIHQNANVWNLFIGDRGIIDTLLNKTIISFASRGDRSLRFLALWFGVAHVLQLLAVTYVAAEKGFDGVFLLGLMFLTWTIEWRTGSTELARQWLDQEGKVLNAQSFRFTGRMPLLGTVQQLSDTVESSWLDPIIAKCPRRDLWLHCMANQRQNRNHMGGKSVSDQERDEGSSTPAVDPKWLELNLKLVEEGYSTVQQHISTRQASGEAQV